METIGRDTWLRVVRGPESGNKSPFVAESGREKQVLSVREVTTQLFGRKSQARFDSLKHLINVIVDI